MTQLVEDIKDKLLQMYFIMISMFCFISCLIIITVRTILGLGDTNVHWQLKATLETLLIERQLFKDTY